MFNGSSPLKMDAAMCVVPFVLYRLLKSNLSVFGPNQAKLQWVLKLEESGYREVRMQ